MRVWLICRGEGYSCIFEIRVWQNFVMTTLRRLCCYFLLKAAVPQMWLFLVREKGLFTELPELLPAASHSSGQPQSVHSPAFYLVQGCQCKMDVSRWEGIGAGCSTCRICTSHLKRSWFSECLHQEQTEN